MDTQLLKKEIRYRARRGMKETDLFLGRFMEAHLDTLDEAELTDLQALLLHTDQDLFAWLSGASTPPDAVMGMIEKIKTCQPVRA